MTTSTQEEVPSSENIDKKDIELIQSQVPDVSLEKIIKTYLKNKCDIVNTIMDLTI